MAYSDSNDPVEGLRRSLIGSPSLRRQVQALGSARYKQVAEALSANGDDPQRFGSLYRDRLKQVLANEPAAQASDNRFAAESQRNAVNSVLSDYNPKLSPTQRTDLLTKRNTASSFLSNAPGGFGTTLSREDPYRYGSIASRSFGSLYRR